MVRTAAPAPTPQPAAAPRVMTARPAPPTAPPAANGGAAEVQITAAGSQAAAQAALDGLRVRFARQVNGRRGRIEPVETDGRTLFRALITGFGSRAEATQVCAALRAGGQACFVRAVG
jgi:hypothetical protein